MTKKENIKAILKYHSYMELLDKYDIASDELCGLTTDMCTGCPFDIDENTCGARHKENPSLASAIKQLRITHPELFI